MKQSPWEADSMLSWSIPYLLWNSKVLEHSLYRTIIILRLQAFTATELDKIISCNKPSITDKACFLRRFYHIIILPVYTEMKSLSVTLTEDNR
jgi:hypothetical protein